MRRYDWHFDAEVFGLSLLSVSPGFSGVGVETDGKSDADVRRAAVETLLIGVGAVLVSRSLVPLVVPFAYLAFEHAWRNRLADTEAGVPDMTGEAQWQ